MEKYLKICEHLHNLTLVPMMMITGKAELIHTWPYMPEIFFRNEGVRNVLENFGLLHRDIRHPLISYIEPGYFLGVVQLEPELYLLLGLVSPIVYSRKEILAICADVIAPSALQEHCDMMMRVPTMNQFQIRDLICILVQAALGEEIPEENILFSDFTFHRPKISGQLGQILFDQREEPDFHVPTEFETVMCGAVESGNLELLVRWMSLPIRGRVGRMSSSELRQEKYTLVCLTTLISRAAIRGGLPAETAFNLGDLYCQRADLLTEKQAVETLSYEMTLDFCEKVKEIRNKASVSPVVRNCLDYISIHLHNPLNLEELSAHCGLCSRSLSIRFKKEMGMGISEYIHREKMQEAKYLLRNTSYSISEISSYLNYPSQSYFTQIFKRYCDLTPQLYRDAPEI